MNMKNKKKILILLLIIILVTLVLLFIDKSTYKEYSKNYFYMDTYINIKISSVKSKSEMDSIFEDIDYLISDAQLPENFLQAAQAANVKIL